MTPGQYLHRGCVISISSKEVGQGRWRGLYAISTGNGAPLGAGFDSGFFATQEEAECAAIPLGVVAVDRRLDWRTRD